MAFANRRFVRVALAAFLTAAPAASWDSKIHPGIVRAALGTLPKEDRLRERWGDEAWRLQQYVQLGDWVNAVVLQQEQWHVGGETLELPGVQFYANDFLIFPGVPRPFQHSVPAVQGTYRPFFLRALRAIRMETPENAARWVGSLLHFVTDTGSPPHTLGISGPNHTHMESDFDTRRIDLTGYQPRLLGGNDEAALEGMLKRLDGLIAFSTIRAKQMLPYAPSNDRAKLNAPALESAAETARVTADVIHTLLQLSSHPVAAVPQAASLTAHITAPALDGMDNLPAKLVFLSTSYSTLTTQLPPSFGTYRGVFSLREIPPGTYNVAVSRPGCEPLQTTLTFNAGESRNVTWNLPASKVPGNLMLNPALNVRWVTKDAPDNWHFDAAESQWISDNIPVVAGNGYRAGFEPKNGPVRVDLQWMSHAWEPMRSSGPSAGTEFQAPPNALFMRFIVHSSPDPSGFLKYVWLASVQSASQ